jgi:hypothetical protein
MKIKLLRNLLLLDCAVLFLLGVLMIFAPRQVEMAFRFTDLPRGAHYLLGMYGCVLVAMAAGYFIAAIDPLRHVAWVQVGIVRGALECVAGAVYVARGIVTWPQAMFGIVVAALFTAAYLALYPREGRGGKA